MITARRRSLAAFALAALFAIPPAGCTGSEGPPVSYLDDADPMALSWAAPAAGTTVEVQAPFDLVLTTQNPSATVMHFAIDGAEVGSCDASQPGQDCHDGDAWNWTLLFATEGMHHVSASFSDASGATVTAGIDVTVVMQVLDSTAQSGADGPDPLSDSEQIDEGTSQIVDGITSARGFLDADLPLHNLCGGVQWRLSGQRVLLARGRIDGSTSQIARCVERYQSFVERYADLDLVSRANMYAALAAAGNCEPDTGWQQNLVTSAQCAALNPGTTPAMCAQQMHDSTDFAVEQLARYLAARPVRAIHQNDPPRVGALLSSHGAVACSRRNGWHLLSPNRYVDHFVAAYNAYRTSESGGTVTIPSGSSDASNVPAVGFTVQPGAVLARQFVGYGAQYNQNLYSAFNASLHAGITPARLQSLHSELVALGPRHVRVFFDSSAFTDPDLMLSFQHTVQLAQDSGASVNVTFWHGPYPDPEGAMVQFAAVLANLRVQGITAVQYVTIQNEVDSTRVTFDLYNQLYRTLDRELRSSGLRDTTQLIGGDLLRNGQGPWFAYMAANMSDILDGYSVHIYWDINAPAYLITRLTEVRKIVNDMPAAQRRPLYVMEYGARGNHTVVPEPGIDANGQLVNDSALAAYQHGWFDVYAASLGYVGFSKWDAYVSAYDHGQQDFGLLGTPASEWERRPVFYVTQLLSHVARPGGQVVRVDGGADLARVAALKSGDDWTVIAANGETEGRYFRVRGLPAGRPFWMVSWAIGAPRSVGRLQVRSDSTGALVFRMPPHAIAGFSTVDPGL